MKKMLLATMRLLLLLFLLSEGAAGSILSVDDGGVYSGITVRIGDDVPRQYCRRVIDGVQHYLSTTSSQLFALTSSRGRFAAATVVLPSSWAGTECVNNYNGGESGGNVTVSPTLYPEDFEPDFAVEPPHPIFGAEPRALHSGQCGRAGRGVSLPYVAVLEEDKLARERIERRVFQEWSRNRYGVFPESGFAGDALYPEFYTDDAGEVRTNEDCDGLADIDSNASAAARSENTRSTNGTDEATPFPLPPALCDSRRSSSYRRHAPSKQHLLCDGRSAAEVVLRHKDFRRARRRAKKKVNKSLVTEAAAVTTRDIFRRPQPSTVPQIRLVLPPVPLKTVLVLDVSQRMRLDDRWKRCREALFVLVSHLPVGSELAIVTFDGSSDLARVNTPLTIVRDDNREGLFGRIPYRLSSDRSGCVECGLNSALEVLGGDGGAVILLSGSAKNEEKERVFEIGRRLRAAAAPVYHIFFDQVSSSASVAEFRESFLVSASRMQKDTLLQRLSSVLRSILGRIGGPKIVNSHQRFISWNGQRSRGTFRVDDEYKDLWIVLTSAQKEDVEGFEVTSPSGRRLAFPQYDHGIVYFRLDGGADVEPGIWSYEARLHHTVSNGAIVSVEVFGIEVRSKSGIKVRAWAITHEQQEQAEKGQFRPVKIFAEVTQDRLPVQGAKVVAVVRKPGSDYDGSVKSEIVLRDNGSGYPDITARDGVYTGYLTDYTPENGFYALSVRATDNEGRAQVSKPYGAGAVNGGGELCCGSALPEYFTVPTQPFERHVTAGSFSPQAVEYFINEDGKPEMRDVFPPSRITDLTVASYGESDLLAELSWSSPGGDLDEGSAAEYEIRCYTNRDALSEERFVSMGIPAAGQIPKPSGYGTSQKATVSLPSANQNYFYGVVAIDGAGNRGQVSNLVRIYIREVTTTTDIGMTFRVVNGSSSSTLVNGLRVKSNGDLEGDGVPHETMVYLIAGGITAFVFIISVLFFVAVCRARKRNAAKRAVSAASSSADTPPPAYAHAGGVDNGGLIMRGNVVTGCGMVGGSAAAATVVALPDCLTPAEKLDHMWSKENSWTYPSLGGGPVSLQPVSPGHQIYQNQQPLSLMALFPATSRHGSVGLPLQHEVSSASEMPTSGSSNASPTCMTNWAAVSNNNNANNSKGSSDVTKKSTDSGTTASTDCSDSDHNSDDKNVYNVPSSTVRRTGHKGDSGGGGEMLMTPSMIALDRKKRQESLV